MIVSRLHHLSSRSLVRWAMCALAVAAVATMRLPASAAEREKPPCGARAGDLALRVSLIPKSGVITAQEPLLAQVDIRNRSKEPVGLGHGGFETRVEIYYGSGKLVAATSKLLPEDYCCVIRPLRPGESLRKLLVISGLYEFRKPGAYVVRVQHLDVSRHFQVLAEGFAGVRVLPFDAARLKARCEELFHPVRVGDYIDTPEVRSLCSIRHEMVLPYLNWIARNYDPFRGCQAIRRVGTEEANKLLGVLANEKGRLGRAARDAQKRQLSVDDFLFVPWP